MDNNLSVAVHSGMLLISVLAFFGVVLWFRSRQGRVFKGFGLSSPPLFGGGGGAVLLPPTKDGLPPTRFIPDISSIGSGRREFHLRWEVPCPVPLEFRIGLPGGEWQSAFQDLLAPLMADQELGVLIRGAGLRGLRYIRLDEGWLRVISVPLPAMGEAPGAEASVLAQKILEHLLPALLALRIPGDITRARLGRHRQIRLWSNALGVSALLLIFLSTFLQYRYTTPGPVLVFWKPALAISAALWAAAFFVYSRVKGEAGEHLASLRLSLILLAPAMFSFWLFVLPQVNTRLDNSPAVPAEAAVKKVSRSFYSMKNGARQVHALTVYLGPVHNSAALPCGIRSFTRWESEFGPDEKPPDALKIQVKCGALGAPWITGWTE